MKQEFNWAMDQVKLPPEAEERILLGFLFIVRAIMSKHLVIQLFSGEKIACAEKDTANHRLKQSDRRPQRILEGAPVDEPDTIGHCIYDITRFIDERIIEGEHLFKPRVHDIADIQHDHENNNRSDTRQSHVEALLYPIGPVDFRRLVQTGRNGRNRRKEIDCLIAQTFPKFRNEQDEGKPSITSEERNCFPAQSLDCSIDGTGQAQKVYHNGG